MEVFLVMIIILIILLNDSILCLDWKSDGGVAQLDNIVLLLHSISNMSPKTSVNPLYQE